MREALRDAFADAPGRIDVLAGQERRELLAAEPDQQRIAARDLPGDGGEQLQHFVAGGMAVAVVDGLEVVEIEGEQRHGRAAGACGPDPFALFDEAAAVGQSREGIALRFGEQVPLRFLADERQEGHRHADGVQHGLEHRGFCERQQQAIPVEADENRHDDSPRGVEQPVAGEDRDRHRPGSQAADRGAAQQRPGCQRGDQGDRQRGDMVPERRGEMDPGDRPNGGQNANGRNRQPYVARPVEPSGRMQDQQVARNHQDVRQRGPARPGEVVTIHGDDASGREDGETPGQDAQQARSTGVRLPLPKHHRRREQQRADRQIPQGLKIDLHRRRRLSDGSLGRM